MGNRIILTNVREQLTDEEIKPQRDYGIFLVGQRISEEKMDSNSDEENDGIKYRIKVERIDSIMDLKENKAVEFERGKTPSQKQRWAITKELGDTEYEPFMKWLLGRITGLCEEYREKL